MRPTMNAVATLDAGSGDMVIAEDTAMLQVLETACMIAQHPSAVLITGETGSGKELVARVVHQYSSRSLRPWVDVNCAALPEHLVESELFGYEKGAFSGADSTKPGLFELAHGGTLFLDEIGEVDPRVQVKLLRVLDSVPYYRLGGSRKVNVDVRVIAATNRDLEAAVHSGTFRRDLFHRISEFHIAVPPLRERPRDIVALAKHFLARLRSDVSFTADALELLSRLNWPGNIRELRNLVSKLSMLVPRPRISADDVRRHLSGDAACPLPEAASLPPHITSVTEMERLMIVRALESTGGNQSLAAEQLGMPRRTFCRKLSEYRIALGRRRNTSEKSGRHLLGNRRAELGVPVSLKPRDGRCILAEATDLGMGGMGLRAVPASLAASDKVTVSFHLPGQSSPMEVEAVIVWIRPDGSAGVKFTSVNAASSEAFRSWIGGSLEAPLPPFHGIRQAAEATPLQALCP